MAKELNEDTTFKMSIKTMGMVAAGIAVVVGGWYSLMQEIQEAKEQPVQVDVNILKEEILKEIPEAEITRMEFDMKDQMIRQTILTTQQDVEEMKKTLEKIEDKLYNR
jgi:Tfp pilus assembly protein PilN|tara:strand:+ start:1092 stop:1415 length:324 start_codon:yes stop_codon:yes gene_type:complete